MNSGSEAVEAALQFALQYHRERGQPQRQEFLSLTRGYHGNTLGGLSLSGHARRAVVGALAWPFAELPVPYRSARRAAAAGIRVHRASCSPGPGTEIERRADRLAGVVVEPVGGATLGATVPPAGYLAGLRALCDEHGVLLITDEVMSGLGRTGAPLAAQHWGVTADIVAVGKGLGAGYTPIAAALVAAPVLAAIADGTGLIHGGHTYAGNPLSAATALAVLTVLRVRAGAGGRGAGGGPAAAPAGRAGRCGTRRSSTCVAGACCWASSWRPTGPVARTAWRAQLREHAMAAGLLVYPATGGFLDAVLVAPPLTSTDDEIDELVRRLDRALHTASRT